MSPNLTSGAIQRIHGGDLSFHPVLQVLDIKKIQAAPGQTSNERYKLVVSDGTHYQQAMLATQLNNLVTSNQVVMHGLICLQDFICNEVQNKKILIILRLDVAGASTGFRIGDPTEYRAGGAPSVHKPAAPQLSTMQGANVPYQPQGQQGGSYQPGGRPAASGYGGQGGGPVSSGASGGGSYHAGGGGQQAKPAYGGAARQQGGPVVRDGATGPILPISELNPYQNRWTIKARVTNRTDIKRWSNAKGEGTVFSIDLLDEYGGEIRAAFFKEAVDKFYDTVEPGKVFTFSGGRLKVAQKQYSSIRNDYEITFDTQSDIRPVEDDHKIQIAQYNFRKINQLEQVDPNTTLDVIGVVKAFTPESTITTKKDGREISKRELTIVDDTGVEVRVTLWGEKASSNPEQWENNPIVAFKGVKVSDFGGRTLGTIPSSQVSVQPDLPEAVELYNWWHSDGATAASVSISTGGGGGGGPATFDARLYLSQIKDEHLGHGEKADYIDCKATITYIKSDPDPWYRACTNGDCKRKVTEEMGGWRCEKCQRTMPECAYRFILSCSATDHTGSSYFSCFDQEAIQILGKTAEELNTYKSSDMLARYEAVFQEANFTPYVFRVRIKVENVNDEQRVKCNIVQARPINYVQECRDLVAAIKSYQ